MLIRYKINYAKNKCLKYPRLLKSTDLVFKTKKHIKKSCETELSVENQQKVRPTVIEDVINELSNIFGPIRITTYYYAVYLQYVFFILSGSMPNLP